jgi:hypothetical protein
MNGSYVVKKGDTLAKIAGAVYSDPGLYGKLAAFNGIIHPDMLAIGRILEIPTLNQLEETVSSSRGSGIKLDPPNGLDMILKTFGNIYKYIQNDGTLAPSWESDYLARCRLPFRIKLSMDHTKEVTGIYCHKKLIDIVPAVFSAIQDNNLQDSIKTYGGCFNFRTKRSGGKLSTHCWGIAIDLNPETNAMGSEGDMNPEIIRIFRNHGFKWGGDWPGKGKDPMHFQFCAGY